MDCFNKEKIGVHPTCHSDGVLRSRFFSKPVSHLCRFVVHTHLHSVSLLQQTICISYIRTRGVTDRAIEWSNVGSIKSKGIESDLSWRTICPPLAYFTSKTSPRAILIFFWTLIKDLTLCLIIQGVLHVAGLMETICRDDKFWYKDTPTSLQKKLISTKPCVLLSWI